MKASVLYALATSMAAVTAQTYSSCDPLTSGNCPADPALGGDIDVNFQDGASDRFSVVSASDAISYGGEGAEFTVTKSGDNPTIQSKFYMMFGRVEAVIRAAPGTGIVSSFVLQSDDLDEIDLEWLGGDTTQVQSNFFSKGDTTTYDRGQFHPVDSPQTTFHNYTVDWTDSQTTWYIDNQVVRTLASDNPEGYPQTPMVIRIGAWAGGDPSNPPGTIEWAGGTTDYSQGPFTFNVLSLFAQDYSTGKEYVYSDRSGSWQSIQAVDGEINGNEGSIDHGAGVQASTSSDVSTTPQPTTSSPPTTTAQPTSTQQPSTTEQPSTTAQPTTSEKPSTAAEPTTAAPTTSEPNSTPTTSSVPSTTSEPAETTSEQITTTTTQETSHGIPTSGEVETSSPLTTHKTTSNVVPISSVPSTTSFRVTTSWSNSSTAAQQTATESSGISQSNDGEKMKYSWMAMIAGIMIALI